ncbi:hypothetical protein BDZ89DRAFT_1066648 [Hymenopellis radicata]|nr:hypothetical protein BDZ89DRAFT_1066648 [Hymenopellis radicata]
MPTMGQCWTIFNIDKGMCIDLLGPKFGEALAEGREAKSLTKLLPLAAVKFPKDPLEGQPYKEAQKRMASKTGICDLPLELQDAIFSELSDPVDVIAFCLTALHFWRIGLPHYKALYMDYVRHAEDWSGDRLICMGDYAEDWPEGLITDERLEWLKASYIYYYGCEPGNISELLGMFSHVLRRWQWPTYDFPRRFQLKRNFLSRPRQKRLKFCPLYNYDVSAWFDLTQSLGSSEHGGTCILRNLSKKVYVRQDALALKSEDGASVYYMSFGSLVLARIAWSNDPSMAMAYASDHDMHRGVWAGDRFDIVFADVIDHEDQWTDVSTAARKELDEIWESEFGTGWEDEVRQREL